MVFHLTRLEAQKHFDEIFQLIMENDVEANQTFLQYSDKILIVFSSM